jgi:hypothetical protein
LPNLINTLISAVLGLIVYGAAIGHLCNVMHTYNKIQIKFARQQEKLIARQSIGKDLFMATLNATTCKVGTNTCTDKLETTNMLPLSDILILHTLQNDIIYSLRKSVISTKTTTKYALYRDDTQHLPQAIVENIKSLRVQIAALPLNKQKVTINVEFYDNYILEITCTLPH